MKKTKKILIFFIITVILFWNPITFYLFYSQTEAYSFSLLKVLFWILPFLACLFIFFLIKTKRKITLIQNLTFCLSFSGIFFGIIVLLNSILGLFIPNSQNSSSQESKKGLIFTPHLSLRYSTIEFDFTEQINSIGLRNKEISIEKKEGTFRILCFGDSWTYGWGVNIEQSYPMQLENYLQENGYSNIEVINCGRHGDYSHYYKMFISKIVPVLKPDLVLVGFLQMDDLLQSYNKDFYKKTLSENTKTGLKTFLKSSLNNYFYFYFSNESQTENTTSLLAKYSEKENNKIIENLNPMQKAHFSILSDTVQTLFKTGNLINAYLCSYMYNSDAFIVFNNPEHPATKIAMHKMDEDVKEMSRICSLNKAKMIFVNMPGHFYSGHHVETMPLEPFLKEYLCENNHIDSIYHSIALKNKLDYFQLTEYFLSLSDKDSYFLKYDGHPTAKGYQEIAAEVSKYLINSNLISK